MSFNKCVETVDTTKSKMSSYLRSVLKSVKKNKNGVIATAAGISLLTAFVINNIRKSHPHETTLCVLTGGLLLGSPLIKSGETKQSQSKSNKNKKLNDIKSVLIDYIKNGQDIGSQISIFIKNKEILNFYAADSNRCINYNDYSLHTIFSSTKNIQALLIGIAINKGWIESYDDNVIKYWPKFPTKQQFYQVKNEEIIFDEIEKEPKYIKISDVLRHESGLNMFFGDDKIITFKCDINKIRKMIENSILRYRKYGDNKFKINVPKSDRCYHGIIRGFILNEIFRRIEPQNRTMNEYFDQEIVPILSKNDPSFKIYLKGRPKTELLPVNHIENINILWNIYHVMIPFIMNITSHLPKLNYFNKYLSDIKYSDFNKLSKLGKINKLPKNHKSYAPQWENATLKTKLVSKLFENEADIDMEYMSATGIANAHSMSKLLSYYLFNHDNDDNDDNKIVNDIIAKPILKYDAALCTLTEFTQGGFNKVELHGIVWYLWGGLGGSWYAFSPKYKCVYSHLVIGWNRHDLGWKDYSFNLQCVAQEPRAKVLFYYLSQYLKSL